jgi:hypothetical protein
MHLTKYLKQCYSVVYSVQLRVKVLKGYAWALIYFLLGNSSWKLIFVNYKQKTNKNHN